MRGDFSRRTFDRKKHFDSVQQQQGRVQLDADWNEQAAIEQHRVETEARDVIGPSGGPLHEAAFHVLTSGTPGLSSDERALPGNALPDPVPAIPAGNFVLTAGKYWVDGILVENEKLCLFAPPDTSPSLSVQPDAPPGAGTLPDVWPSPWSTTLYTPPRGFAAATPDNHLVYLDVWRRLITAQEDPSLREIALGGPDTTARTRTVWQVRIQSGIAATDCPTALAALLSTAHQSGTLRARAREQEVPDDPCIVPASAGYRGLENQLYRAEIHDSGQARQLRTITVPPNNSGLVNATLVADLLVPGRLVGLDRGSAAAPTGWMVGTPLQIYAAGDASKAVVRHIVGRSESGAIWWLNGEIRGFSGADVVVRRLEAPTSDLTSRYATFKWSRDNAAVAVPIERIEGPPSPSVDARRAREITVHDLGRDSISGIAGATWVEISDDFHDLAGVPGQLFMVESVDEARRVVTLMGVPERLDPGATGVNADRHPKLRRWDGLGAVEYKPSADPDEGWIELESGVQIRFVNTGLPADEQRLTYRSGDFWQIPARTATTTSGSGQVEWPSIDPDRPPSGIDHHYCALAVISVGTSGTTVSDCRRPFPPLTELVRVRSLQAVGGDGQDGAPGAALPLPIEVEVRDLLGPVQGAHIRFAVASGGLDPNAGVGTPELVREVVTDHDGRARVYWRLGLTSGPQEATALLLDGPPTGLNLRFTANVIAGDCGELVARSVEELRNLFNVVIGPGQSARICIAPGAYPLTETLVVTGKGHLQISGAGDASVLRGSNVESALRFVRCAAVTMRDLRVETTLSTNLPDEGGAIELSGCERVTLEHLRVSSSGGAYRAAACISVSSSASVRIRSCDLSAGDGQLGIQVLDAQRAEIEDNTLQLAPGRRDFSSKLAAERSAGTPARYGRYVDSVTKFLMHRTFVQLGAGHEAPRWPQPDSVSGLYPRKLTDRLRDMGLGEELEPYMGLIERERARFAAPAENPRWSVTFEAPRVLIKPWLELLGANPFPPGGRLSLARLKDHLGALSDRIITQYLDGTLQLEAFRAALELLAKGNRAVGARGIVVAGAVFGETRILNNTVSGFAAGIHVGHSYQRQTRRAARTLIMGNTVRVRINGEHWHDRHGIFSGNSENTLIEGNSVTADLAPLALGVPLEGIRVYGIFGPMLMVRANQTIDCQLGIRARAVNPGSYSASVWRVHDNAVRGTSTPFDISPPMP